MSVLVDFDTRKMNATCREKRVGFACLISTKARENTLISCVGRWTNVSLKNKWLSVMSDERTSFCLRPNTQIYSGLSVVLSLTLVPPITVSTRILSLGMSPLVILTAEARLVQRIMSTPGNVFKGFSFWLQIDPSTAFSNKSRVRLGRSVDLMIFSFWNTGWTWPVDCIRTNRVLNTAIDRVGMSQFDS